MDKLKDLKNETIKALDIRSMLSEEMDEKLILDSIEGETNIHELILEIDDEIFDRECTIEAIDIKIQTLNDRKTRHNKFCEKARNVILAAMDKAGIETIKGAASTISVKETPRNLIVTDVIKIPSEFFMQQEPKLDKKALLDAIKDGANIEGAELTNGGISLQIRRK